MSKYLCQSCIQIYIAAIIIEYSIVVSTDEVYRSNPTICSIACFGLRHVPSVFYRIKVRSFTTFFCCFCVFFIHFTLRFVDVHSTTQVNVPPRVIQTSGFSVGFVRFFKIASDALCMTIIEPQLTIGFLIFICNQQCVLF